MCGDGAGGRALTFGVTAFRLDAQFASLAMRMCKIASLCWLCNRPKFKLATIKKYSFHIKITQLGAEKAWECAGQEHLVVRIALVFKERSSKNSWNLLWLLHWSLRGLTMLLQHWTWGWELENVTSFCSPTHSLTLRILSTWSEMQGSRIVTIVR